MELDKINVKGDKFVAGQVDAYISGYELTTIILDECMKAVPEDIMKGYIHAQKALLHFKDKELTRAKVYESYEEGVKEQVAILQKEKEANESKIIVPGKDIKVATDDGMSQHDKMFNDIKVKPK